MGVEREVITFNGKPREVQIEQAKRLKAELESQLPALAALREALIAEGMMAPGLKGLRAIKTATLDYDVRRDDPDHDAKNWAKPPIDNEEIRRDRDEFQAGKIREARTAQLVPERRGGRGRRT